MVGGERNGGRGSRKSLTPVSEQLVQTTAGQGLPLPDGVVRVVDREWEEGRFRAGGEGVVQHGQFTVKDAPGPVIRYDVVLREQERMLGVRLLEQQGPQQRPTLQVEWTTYFDTQKASSLRLPLRCRQFAEIANGQRQLETRSDDLLGLPIDHDKGGPQRLVARDDTVDGSVECVDIEQPLHPDR